MAIIPQTLTFNDIFLFLVSVLEDCEGPIVM